jgi:hypothetical protein
MNDDECVVCEGSGWSKQGWTDKNGFSEDQYGPCSCEEGRKHA